MSGAERGALASGTPVVLVAAAVALGLTVTVP